MTWAAFVAIAAGGAIGAPLRYLIDGRITAAVTDAGLRRFPWGLLAVNALGSVLIGVAYVMFEGPWRALVATGACGALTTYSSYALFVHRTWQADRAAALVSVIVMPVACIGMCALSIVALRTFIA